MRPEKAHDLIRMCAAGRVTTDAAAAPLSAEKFKRMMRRTQDASAG